MAGIIRSKTVATRKERVCFGCGRKFLAGTEMVVDVVAEDGHVWNCYLCKTCEGITREMRWGDEFGFGDLRDEALEVEADKEVQYNCPSK